MKTYYRIFDRKKRKYVRFMDGGFLVLEYPKQADNYIKIRLNNSDNFEVRKWKR